MARYDYHCPACGTVIEVEHPMGEKPEICCPACGAVCERVFNASAVQFVGSGFYNTDSKEPPKKSSGGCSSCTSGDCAHCA